MLEREDIYEKRYEKEEGREYIPASGAQTGEGWVCKQRNRPRAPALYSRPSENERPTKLLAALGHALATRLVYTFPPNLLLDCAFSGCIRDGL